MDQYKDNGSIGQVRSRWHLVPWDCFSQRLYPTLHAWRRDKPKWARGEGHCIIARPDAVECRVALVDLLNCCIMVFWGDQLRDCLHSAERWLEESKDRGWCPLVSMPEPGPLDTVYLYLSN